MYMHTCTYTPVFAYNVYTSTYPSVCLAHPYGRIYLFNQLRPSEAAHRHADSCLRLLFAGLQPSFGAKWDG